MPIKCKSVAAPADGFQECTGVKYGDTCSFKCKDGYEVQGNPQVTCRAVKESFTGKWIGEHEGKTHCVPIDCGTPITPVGATAVCEGTVIGKSCSFTCIGKDKIKGATNQRCRADGTWSGIPIECEELKCQKIWQPSNGVLSCNGQGIKNHCELRCLEGYTLKGPSRRVCRRTVIGSKEAATWTGSPARCVRTLCPKLEPLVDGVQACDGHNSGQSCLLRCADGFVLSGSYARTCELTGKWSGKNSKCLPVDCGKQAAPHGGKAVCDGASYRHKCRFVCDKGRELIGSGERVCLKDGFWSGKRAECRSIKCKPRANPVDGRLSCDGTSVSDTCTTSCNHGYVINGVPASQCAQSGKWSHPAANCTKMICPKLEAPMYGQIKCDASVYGSSCAFTCNEGYEIDGATPVRRCLAGGLWSGSPLTCKKKDCGTLAEPLNGFKHCPDGTTVGKNCHFKCNLGFTLSPVVAMKRTCAVNGEWSGKLAVCVPMDCGVIFAKDIIANCKFGTTVGKTCNLQCPLGYEPEKSSTTQCTNNGTWTGPLKCKKHLCQQPQKPAHGTMTCKDGYVMGSACKFGCDKGYRMSGSQTRVCDESGVFNGSPAKCGRIQCPALEKPTGGVMSCKMHGSEQAVISTDITPGSQCDFGCDFGFTFRGSDKRKCNEVGQWSGENAACDKKRCDPPSVLPGCNLKCGDALEFGTNCSLSARPGYQLSSNKTVEKLTCTGHGQWTKTDSVCNVARCPTLPNPQNGRTLCTKEDLQGSQCGIQCDGNVVRAGVQARVCGLDNKWSAGVQECKVPVLRMTKYNGISDVEPVFNYFSETGNVGLRLESMSPPKPKKVFVDFISRKNSTVNGTQVNGWLVGLMADNSLSFCYGTHSNHKCALRFDASGSVNFLGPAYFHGDIKAEDKQVTVASSTDVDFYSDTFIQELDDDEALPQDGELIQDEKPGQQRASYDLRIGQHNEHKSNAALYGASWVSSGKVGVQIESRDAKAYRAVYTEFRNQGLSNTFSIGMQNDTTLYIGYGFLGTMVRAQSMSVSEKKAVVILGDAVFHTQPSYFKEGTSLNLKPHTPLVSKSVGNRVQVKAESADNVREVPRMTETGVGTTLSAEPLATYYSVDSIGMKIESLGNQEVTPL